MLINKLAYKHALNRENDIKRDRSFIKGGGRWVKNSKKFNSFWDRPPPNSYRIFQNAPSSPISFYTCFILLMFLTSPQGELKCKQGGNVYSDTTLRNIIPINTSHRLMSRIDDWRGVGTKLILGGPHSR